MARGLPTSCRTLPSSTHWPTHSWSSGRVCMCVLMLVSELSNKTLFSRLVSSGIINFETSAPAPRHLLVVDSHSPRRGFSFCISFRKY